MLCLRKSEEDVFDLGHKEELEEKVRFEILQRMEVNVGVGDNGWAEAKRRQNEQKMEGKSMQQQSARITAKFGDEILKFNYFTD